MAPAASLAAAAGQAADNLQLRYLANQLKTQLGLFWANNIDLFPESQPNNHPMANWFILIAALVQTMPSNQPPLQQLTAAQNLVYRLCWMGSFAQGAGLISNTQANTLLASYNSLIAFP